MDRAEQLFVDYLVKTRTLEIVKEIEQDLAFGSSIVGETICEFTKKPLTIVTRSGSQPSPIIKITRGSLFKIQTPRPHAKPALVLIVVGKLW